MSSLEGLACDPQRHNKDTHSNAREDSHFHIAVAISVFNLITHHSHLSHYSLPAVNQKYSHNEMLKVSPSGNSTGCQDCSLQPKTKQNKTKQNKTNKQRKKPMTLQLHSGQRQFTINMAKTQQGNIFLLEKSLFPKSYFQLVLISNLINSIPYLSAASKSKQNLLSVESMCLLMHSFKKNASPSPCK